MEKVVSAIGLTKEFNGFKAVDDVSFHLNKGEILGLLGPNGAGKTTTIHMLLGLTTPTSGEVKVFGKSLETNREEILSIFEIDAAGVFISRKLSSGQLTRVSLVKSL